MLLDGVLETGADFIERLIPGNAFELPFAALPNALHRELQAFGRIETLTDGAAAVAGADLRELTVGHARVRVTGVVRFYADHAPVLRGAAQKTTAAAVDRTHRPCDGFDVGRRGRDRTAHRRRRKARGASEERRTSQEVTSIDHKKSLLPK